MINETWVTLKHFVEKMKSTTSTLKKKEIIESYKDDDFVKECLKYTLDPFKMYYVTSKNCKKLNDIEDDTAGFVDVFELLDDLDNRTYTGHDAIAMVNGYGINREPFVQELLYSIIDKNLQIRANSKLVNSVIPGLIPTFNLALANSYDPKHANFETETWYASRKLDGVRCIAIMSDDGKEIKLHSRAGKEFDTLAKVKRELKYAMKPGEVWDGEICIMDQDGNESFQGIMKEIRRKNHTIKKPKFWVFDRLTQQEFYAGNSFRKLSDRNIHIHHTNRVTCDTDIIDFLPFTKVRSEIHLQEMIDHAESLGHEGVMIRKDDTYKGKRSNDILKVKKMHDEEYTIVDLDFGDHRIIENGQEITERLLSQVYIEHKGNRVGIGSGFSKAERKYYTKNHEELIGKTITVQYFEETLNDEGNYSLRFPVVKHIYKNGRNC